MADAQFTSRERKEVYRLIVLLNSSLRFFVLHLEELTTTKIFNRKYLKELIGFTKKIQTEMNELIGPKEKKQ